MNYSFSISTKKADEYRIYLVDADISVLADNVKAIIELQGIDISEIIIDRVSGGNATSQEVLHAITGRIADLFADHPTLIIYYSCDDMNPIPSRNTKGSNRDISVQEYRSRLFSHIFDTYMNSHRVSGFSNTPIRIKGDGYIQFMHLIARDELLPIVDLIRDDIIEGWSKPN